MLSLLPALGGIYNIYDAQDLNLETYRLFSLDLNDCPKDKLYQKQSFAEDTARVNMLFQKHVKNMSLSFLVNTVVSIALIIFVSKWFVVFFAFSFALASLDSHYINQIYHHLHSVDEKILKYVHKVATKQEDPHFEEPILEEVNKTNRFLNKTTLGYVITGVFSAGLHVLGYTHAGIAIHGAAFLWNVICSQNEENKNAILRKDGTLELVEYAEKLLQEKYKIKDIRIDHLQRALINGPPSLVSMFLQKA